MCTVCIPSAGGCLFDTNLLHECLFDTVHHCGHNILATRAKILKVFAHLKSGIRESVDDCATFTGQSPGKIFLQIHLMFVGSVAEWLDHLRSLNPGALGSDPAFGILGFKCLFDIGHYFSEYFDTITFRSTGVYYSLHNYDSLYRCVLLVLHDYDS